MWADRETHRDCLGFSTYVGVLAEICLRTELAPLTMGIFGSWGSGKTSLMQMMKARIDGGHNEQTKTLWFNAWRYEGREEGQAALVHAIIADLEKDLTFKEQAGDLIKKVKDNISALKLGKFLLKTAVTFSPDVDQFIDCFRDESDRVASSMQSFEADFERLLDKAALKRVLVFIDDLDRCSSSKVIETFETIKLFLNLPACTFIIGADPEKIEQAVGDVHHIDDPKTRRDYLEKIVQMPFTIPAQRLPDIACYVGMLILGRRATEESWGSLVEQRAAFCTATDPLATFAAWATDNRLALDFDEGGVRSVIGELTDVLPHVDILAQGLRGNPRRIKRFLNTLALRRSLAEANQLAIDARTLIKLAVLEYSWPEFFDVLVETADPATGRSPLVAAVLSAESDDKVAQESPIVAESIARLGLLEYLKADPVLQEDLDLGPYLFLAQTSLSRGQAPVLRPAEETMRRLLAEIASDDALRSKAAAQRVASGDASTAAGCIRALLRGLSGLKEAGVQTHVVRALDIIVDRHTEHAASVVAAINEVEFEGREGVALAAASLLKNAVRRGHPEVPELRERLKKTSRLVAAMFPDRAQRR